MDIDGISAVFGAKVEISPIKSASTPSVCLISLPNSPISRKIGQSAEIEPNCAEIGAENTEKRAKNTEKRPKNTEKRSQNTEKVSKTTEKCIKNAEIATKSGQKRILRLRETRFRRIAFHSGPGPSLEAQIDATRFAEMAGLNVPKITEKWPLSDPEIGTFFHFFS
jgi:hypothetical protein